MVTPMRLPCLHQALLCVALSAAVGCVQAAEAKHQAIPDNSNAAIDPPAAPNDRFDDADLDGAIATSHVQRIQKPKPPVTAPARTTGDTRAMPSRFHSFLPGMFR